MDIDKDDLDFYGHNWESALEKLERNPDDTPVLLYKDESAAIIDLLMMALKKPPYHED